ncbi:MAG: hypothetical protein Ta2D_08510 [Rickettsiales bacterium]|nr:MAG: hypothetical protein Ta2D_08510 [Rickettsiales bacterium]
MELKRTYFKNKTTGILSCGDNFFYTLELPYLNNQRNISCIPEGIYIVKKNFSNKFGWCFRLSNPVNRSDILIHSGNKITDTSGCILIGKSFKNDELQNSKIALKELLNLASDTQNLIIMENK